MKNYQLLRDKKQKDGFMITMRRWRLQFKMWLWKTNDLILILILIVVLASLAVGAIFTGLKAFL